MELTALGLFAAALFVAAGSPGPSIAALVARVLSRGLGSVLPFLAAMGIGEVMWLVAAVLGLGFIAQSFGTAFMVLKFAGVAYLLFLAWGMWHAPVTVEEGSLPEPQGAVRMFLAGLALTIGNPKIMVFYIALLPTLLDLQTVSMLGLLELVAVAFAVLVVVDLAWAIAAAWARGWLKSPRAMRIANRGGATAMTGAAIVIATR